MVQVVGALAILAGFSLTQVGALEVQSRRYLWLNLVGLAVLIADAFHGAQLGFFLLEAVLMLVSGWGLLALLRGRSPSMSY